MDSLFVVNCSLVLSALCVFFFPFVTSYSMLLTVGAFFGLSIAAYISLTRCKNILQVENVGKILSYLIFVADTTRFFCHVENF